MNGASSSADGVSGFVAALEQAGAAPELRGGVVAYQVTPVTGALAGQTVETGVGADELRAWPAAPPHWIHLPIEINFARTNTDQSSTLPGWRRHSRQPGPWNGSRPPALTWLAHVRAVLGEAV